MDRMVDGQYQQDLAMATRRANVAEQRAAALEQRLVRQDRLFLRTSAMVVVGFFAALLVLASRLSVVHHEGFVEGYAEGTQLASGAWADAQQGWDAALACYRRRVVQTDAPMSGEKIARPGLQHPPNPNRDEDWVGDRLACLVCEAVKP